MENTHRIAFCNLPEFDAEMAQALKTIIHPMLSKETKNRTHIIILPTHLVTAFHDAMRDQLGRPLFSACSWINISRL